MFDNKDNDYLGRYMNECPKCGHRYNKKLHGNKCPDCGYRKGVGKVIPFVIVILIIIGILFKDKIFNMLDNIRLPNLFDAVNPVYLLMLLNIILYFVGFNSSNSDKYGNSYYDTVSLREYYRLISSGFTHADLLHLMCNTYSLYNLGIFVYNRAGSLMFFVIYFVSMIFGGLISSFLHHKSGNNYIKSIGASGAICGLLGFYIIYIFKMNINPIETTEYIYKALLPLSVTALNPRIDNLGHISGLAIGLVLSLVLTSSLNYVVDNHTNQTVLTSKQTKNATKVIIYEPGYSDDVVRNSFYVEDIELLNNAINNYEQKIAEDVYIQAERVEISISILENMQYYDTNVIDTTQVMDDENDLIDYLLYGNNGNPTITFVTTCKCYNNGEYFEKVFYNGVEQH